jgi:hypothetical protein
MGSYELARQFLKKYPMTIAWRLRQHCKVIDKHLNPDEKILYIFAGQKNDSVSDLVNTNVVALTDKRIMVATKRLLFGYFFKSITPDMYNDLTVSKGLIFGRVTLDTVKEVVTLTNIDPKALNEIESNITEIMLKLKKEYVKESKNQE